MRCRRALAGMLAVPLLALTGCLTIPAASNPVTVTDLPDESLDAGSVQIEPLAPRAGQQSDEVVRGFLAASASTVRGRPVARQYLTSQAAQEWSPDEAGVTVIERDFAAVPSSDEATVTVTGRVSGTVGPEGIYSAGPADFQQTFTLQQVNGQWRIDNPPTGVILTVDDFSRAYLRNNLYFLDPGGTKVVPDPRYFLADSPAPANTLVEALLRGPSPFLAPAVRTELAPGAALVRNVQERRDVRIDFSGLGELSPAAMQGLSAQLVWTLKQLPITSVTITSDGQVLSVPGVGLEQQVNDWPTYDPDFVPADTQGHFVSNGAVFTVTGVPVPGPVGQGAYGLLAAAATADQSSLAGISAGPAGASLLVGAYGGELQPVLTGRSFTPPSGAGAVPEFWTVRDGSEVVRVSIPVQAQVVSAPELAGRSPVTALRLSRDGTRAALVTQAGQLFLARIVRTGSAVELSGLTQLAMGLPGVSDVAWSSAVELLILATDPADGRRKPWQVSVDGAMLTEQTVSNLPDQPNAIAAAPGRPPLVSAGGSIYQLGDSTWTTLVRGQPIFAGTSPFYPG